MAGYSSVYKAGRAWNGAHRDKGTVVHLVDEDEPNGAWMSKALCGAQPGYRSYGWSKTNKEVNCQSCIKKSKV